MTTKTCAYFHVPCRSTTHEPQTLIIAVRIQEGNHQVHGKLLKQAIFVSGKGTNNTIDIMEICGTYSRWLAKA